jgi:surface polysaccharide O-acyltransferase-like enzyme
MGCGFCLISGSLFTQSELAKERNGLRNTALHLGHIFLTSIEGVDW